MCRRFIASNCVSAGLYLDCIVQRGWRLRCKSLFAANNIAFLRAPSILESAEEKRWMELWTLIRRKPGAMEACFRLCIFLCGIQINQSCAHIHARVLIMWPPLTPWWQSISFPSALLTFDSPTHPKITRKRTVREKIRLRCKNLKLKLNTDILVHPFPYQTRLLSHLVQLTFYWGIDTSPN